VHSTCHSNNQHLNQVQRTQESAPHQTLHFMDCTFLGAFHVTLSNNQHLLGFMPVLPVIGSIAGIITGYIARKNIAANPALYSGDGMAKGGIILGWIGVALLVLVVAGLVLFLTPLTFTTVQQAIPVHP
jgi:hypothetical protein